MCVCERERERERESERASERERERAGERERELCMCVLGCLAGRRADCLRHVFVWLASKLSLSLYLYLCVCVCACVSGRMCVRVCGAFVASGIVCQQACMAVSDETTLVFFHTSQRVCVQSASALDVLVRDCWQSPTNLCAPVGQCTCTRMIAGTPPPHLCASTCI